VLKFVPEEHKLVHMEYIIPCTESYGETSFWYPVVPLTYFLYQLLFSADMSPPSSYVIDCHVHYNHSRLGLIILSETLTFDYIINLYSYARKDVQWQVDFTESQYMVHSICVKCAIQLPVLGTPLLLLFGGYHSNNI